MSIALKNAQTVFDAYMPLGGCSAPNKRGVFVYRAGEKAETFFRVQVGRVAIQKEDEEGRSIFLGLYGAGDYFGEESLGPSPGIWRGNARAIDRDMSVMSWPGSEVRGWCKNNKSLSLAAMDLALGLADERGCLARISMSHGDLCAKLAAFLQHFGERMGAQQADGIHLASLTHEMLSSMLGTSREVITDRMNTFRREGFILYSRKEIVLRRCFDHGAAARAS
jgi:CRP/FNR family transcriptional regulator, cyclic AMP receptor protein